MSDIQPPPLGRREFVPPRHRDLQYTGRIDLGSPAGPAFFHSASSVRTRFTGTALGLAASVGPAEVGTWIGVRIDGGHEMRLFLAPGTDTVHQIAVGLEDGPHDLLLYRRSDPVNGPFQLRGLVLDPGCGTLLPPARPDRRIEFYGDSVTSGTCVEAVGYEGRQDEEVAMLNATEPLTNGYWSYASIAARKMGAEAHINGIGGLALHDGNGWWGGERLTGLLTTWDKLCPIPGRLTPWDFERFVPHVVVVAIGQNDARYRSAQDAAFRRTWTADYVALLGRMRGVYPNARFVLTTTILTHDPEWDDMVDDVAAEAGPGVVSFRYRRAGLGTPGHPRLAEHQEMAHELAGFLESMPGAWDDAT